MGSLSEIKCAIDDAKLFYESISYAAGDSVDHQSSFVLQNPTSAQVSSHLELARRSIQPEDTHVFYYSGHGVTVADHKVKFCFRDTESDGHGGLMSNILFEQLRAIKCKECVVILDCCHSGASLAETNISEYYQSSSASVLASCRAHETSSFSEDVSTFTNALCLSIRVLAASGHSLSLTKLVEQTISRLPAGAPKPILRIGSLHPNVELVEEGSWFGLSLPNDFIERLVRRLSTSDLLVRELVWGDLIHAPDRLKIDVLNEYLLGRLKQADTELAVEPSWRVRRTIGIVLGSIDPSSGFQKEIIEKFLTSQNWMHRCVGLVAASYSKTIERYEDLLLKILDDPSGRPDDIWLAHLYLSDIGAHHLSNALNSVLGSTSWGVIDIWRCYKRHQIPPSKIWVEVKNAVERAAVQKNSLKDLAFYVCLEEETNSFGSEHSWMDEVRSLLDHEALSQLEVLLSSPIQQSLMSTPSRPRVPAKTTQRCAIYEIYGLWREDHRLELRHMLDDLTSEALMECLGNAYLFPVVGHKMSLCRSLNELISSAKYSNRAEEVRAAMTWTLADTHPWVRREGLALFEKIDSRLSNVFRFKIDHQFHPGIFDLFLQAAQIGKEVPEDVFSKFCSVPSDMTSLTQAIRNEF